MPMVISAPDTNDIALEAELLDPAGGAHLRLRFSGPFEGKNVTWDIRSPYERRETGGS